METNPLHAYPAPCLRRRGRGAAARRARPRSVAAGRRQHRHPCARRLRRRRRSRSGTGQGRRPARLAGRRVTTYWKVYGRNKRSLALDYLCRLVGAVLALVRTADILVENFVPGGLEKMGLGPEVLHAVNPALVIVRVSGWGQTGPFSPQARLRDAGRGDERLRRDERFPRSRAGPAAARAGRHGQRRLRRVGRDDRAARVEVRGGRARWSTCPCSSRSTRSSGPKRPTCG